MEDGIKMQETEAVLRERDFHGESAILSNNIVPEDPQEILKKWPIIIRPLNKGCVVEVGCKVFGFSNLDEAITEVKEYTKNPSEMMKKYNIK